MTAGKAALATFLVCLAVPVARAADAPPVPPSAYRSVMEAQYAARTPMRPMRPDEAQRIYENYLHSIGKPAKELSVGGSNTTPSR